MGFKFYSAAQPHSSQAFIPSAAILFADIQIKHTCISLFDVGRRVWPVSSGVQVHGFPSRAATEAISSLPLLLSFLCVPSAVFCFLRIFFLSQSVI